MALHLTSSFSTEFDGSHSPHPGGSGESVESGDSFSTAGHHIPLLRGVVDSLTIAYGLTTDQCQILHDLINSSASLHYQAVQLSVVQIAISFQQGNGLKQLIGTAGVLSDLCNSLQQLTSIDWTANKSQKVSSYLILFELYITNCVKLCRELFVMRQ